MFFLILLDFRIPRNSWKLLTRTTYVKVLMVCRDVVSESDEAICDKV